MKANPETKVAVYATMRMLQEFKRIGGLEALLEYIDKYVATINARDVRAKEAVDRILQHVSTKEIMEGLL